MSAVPVHEVGRRVAAGQVLTRYAKPPVAHRAGRVDDGVVAGQQVIPGDFVTEVHGADEPDAVVLEHAAQVVGNRLDRLVVRCDAVPDQPVRGRQAVDDVDAD